jgi:hypothetical protein
MDDLISYHIMGFNKLITNQFVVKFYSNFKLVIVSSRKN